MPRGTPPGEPYYRFSGEGNDIEVFFRGITERDLMGDPLEKPIVRRQRFFANPPPSKRWTEIVGEPLLTWSLPGSLGFMSPWARAYYLPGYMLTLLPLLGVMPFEPFGKLPQVPGGMDTLEFVGEIIESLIPPSGTDVWASMGRLPPESVQSWNRFGGMKAGDFLGYVSHFNPEQRRAIGLFVEFALATYLFYLHPDPEDQVEMDALHAFWIEPT